MKTFYHYLLKLEAGETPPAPPAPAPGSPPPPGGDPLGGLGGGPGADPTGAPAQTRKSINVTTVWDAIREVLGKDAHRKLDHHKEEKPKEVKKPKSLIQ